MTQDLIIQGGRRLGDFEADSNTPDVDLYPEMRQHLVTTQRPQWQMRDPAPFLDSEEDMATRYPEQPEDSFSHNNSARQDFAVRDSLHQSNTSSTPFVIDDSPFSTPQAPPRISKRPASPSLTQHETSKRQKTRQNTPFEMSPSRPLSNGPGKNLFNFDVDFDEQQGYLGDMEIYEGEGDYSPNGHGSGTRSVYAVVRSGSHQLSRPSSARQTPAREHVSPTHQTTSRGYTPSQQHPHSSTRLRRTPQQHFLPNRDSQHRSGSRLADDPHRQVPETTSSSRREHQQVQEEINMDHHNMEDEIEVVEDPMAFAASLMRAARSQSRPPHRASTVPAETFREQIQYEQNDVHSGSRSVRGTTPGSRVVRDDGPRTPSHNHVEQTRRTHRSVSRQQTPKSDHTPRRFVLDNLGASIEDELEEDDMTSLFADPRHKQNQHSRQQSFQPTIQSPFQRAQTPAPAIDQPTNYQSRPKTPTTFHRQPQSEKHSVKPQLASPCWSSGSGQRITGSSTRPRALFHPQNGAFNSFPEEYRSRGRSVAPHPIHQQRNELTSSVNNEQRSRSRSIAHQDHLQHQTETGSGFSNERRARSKSAVLRTPAIERVRSQSRYRTSSRNDCANSYVYEDKHAQASKSRPQTPQIPTRRASNTHGGLNGFIAREIMETRQYGQSPKTPKRVSQDEVDSDNDEFHTPFDELIRRNQQQANKAPPLLIDKANTQKISGVIPSGSAFDMAKPKSQKRPQPGASTPKNEANSGRGLNNREVINLCSPDNPPRSVPMNKRLSPAVKKLAPKKAIEPSAMLAKSVKVAAQSKRVAKEKISSVDPEEIRQKRAAEIIIDREQKSDQQTRDLALFGEIVHDQAAEDKKAEEARAKGQREREAKMAAMLAKEEADKKIAEAEQKRKQAEAEKRKREKEIEEEQKKLKREADRKRQLAHENREKELLRKAAEHKIRAERERKTKEEEQRELEKQRAKEKAKSVQADAEELAKLKAKQEQAKLQAASLSSAKLPSIPPSQPAEEQDDLFGEMKDEESLFVPEGPPVVPEKTKHEGSTATKTNNPKNNKNPASSIGVDSLEKEAEDMRQKQLLEKADQIRERMGARFSRTPAAVIPPPRPVPISRTRPAAPPSKVVTRPEPVVAKSLSTPALAAAPDPMPPPKPAVEKIAPSAPPDPTANIDRRPPRPHNNSVPKPKNTQDTMSDKPRSQSSSTSGEIASSFSYLQKLAANPLFPGMSKSFGGYARSQNNPSGSMLPKYNSRVNLISDLERERLEKAQKKKRVRVRESHRQTEEQKQEMARKAADKRTEKAKEKQIERIRETAENKGLEISEEEVNAQVEIFLEKRAIDLQKRNESLARRAQDLGHSFGRISSSDETPTAAQKLLRDSELNDDLSPEELQLRQRQRDNQAARVAYGKIRNSAFDKAAARKSVNDLTDSEESEEDPDPEPEVEAEAESEEVQQQRSAEDGEREASSDVESSSNSESEDDVESMTSYEMSASFASIAAETNLRKDKKRIDALNLRDLLPDSGTYQERMVMLYKVSKLEVSNGNNLDEDTKFEDVILEQFTSLRDANSFATDMVRNMVEGRQYVKLKAGYKEGKYGAAVALDENHEIQIFIDGDPVAQSKLSPQFIADIRNRMPEQFWMVRQTTFPRAIREVNEETRETIIRHDTPQVEDYGEFTVLEMANHEACEKLIALFRPIGADMDLVAHYLEVSKIAREARDACNADGRHFEVEIDEDSISAWMPYHKIEMVVKSVALKGPLN